VRSKGAGTGEPTDVAASRCRTGVTLSGQSSAALGTEDERARLLAVASAILLFCSP
jgi:hypothetical protein